MRIRSRLCAAIAVLALCALPATACGSKIENTFFGQHTLDLEEAAGSAAYGKYAVLTEIADTVGATQVDYGSFSATGCIVINGSYVYDVENDKPLLKDAGYSGMSFASSEGAYYITAVRDGKNFAFTTSGETIVSDMDQAVLPTVVSAYRNGKRASYLKFVELSGAARFAEIKDGMLTSAVYGEDEVQTTGFAGLKPGDKYTSEGELYSDYLGLVYDDRFADSHYVKEITSYSGKKALDFYDANGKRISRFKFDDKLADDPIYIDGKLLYTLVAYVDSSMTEGYNFIDDAGDKWMADLYSFDIGSGKTSEIEADFLILSQDSDVYNYSTKSIDASVVTVARMENGVAVEYYSETDIYMVNGSGEVLFKGSECYYGAPVSRIGSNFVTSKGNIVDADLELVAEMPDYVLYVPDLERLFCSDGVNTCLMNYSGKVIQVYDYEYVPNCEVGDGKIAVSKDGELYILDLNSAVAEKISDKVSAPGSITLNGKYVYVSDNGYSNVYKLDGTLYLEGIAVNVSENLDRSIIEYYDGTVGLLPVSTAEGIRYYRAVW